MQREIKRRAQLYGIAAIILALILGAICYNVGVQPPQKVEESAAPTTTEPQPQATRFLKTFQSYKELLNFLTENLKMESLPFFWDARIAAPDITQGAPMPAAPEAAGEFKLSVEYSTTNVQVAGVDEADIVKTDGEYIYFIANNTILILKAYPPEEVNLLSKITFKENVYPAGIFVSSDGAKLAVIGVTYTFPWPIYRTMIYLPYLNTKTFVYVYDVSNKANPVLERNFTISGSYFGARMIGDYVYVVASQPTYIIYDTVILPKVYEDDEIKEIKPEQIYYCSNSTDDYYIFTTIAAINMLEEHEEPNTLTVMMGGTSTLYASTNNLYITFHASPDQTSIYRIRIEGGNLAFEAKGTVPGRELNQFSMDEYDGYFRIATTTWHEGKTRNNIYVMDMSLNIVGSLTDIAPEEAIDSARFIGDRCYLATSVSRRDPFFVIDLKNPRAPEVLGYLKIPGFTSYLHPYDENHIIGIGKDEDNKVKVAIFDVSNITSPVEIDNYVILGEWSDTPVFTEHKAFLFSKDKELMAFPVTVFEGGMWQGAYIFTVTTSYGISL
ncbi:beta-propeller domain-containing protein, partial [Candidatus Bathyarchaeota archaeon]|nr:beta-propeller domain-containing protein [Candidatus Bathyarchaeota archaeon]